MTPAWILFDWGDTLMSEDGPADLPMARWPEVRVIDGAAAVLAALAGRVRLAVVSNARVSTGADIAAALARAGLGGAIDAIFCFRDLGFGKSDPRFWDAVVAATGAARARLLVVGDNLGNDVLAPERAGLGAVWLNWKRAPLPAGIPAPTTIERLVNLLPLLGA